MAKIIPFKDRILVTRRVVGEKVSKESLIYVPETTADRPTDLADVVAVPDLTFADSKLIENASSIISALTIKAKEGNADSLKMLLEYNDFLKIKSIKKGDAVMIGKYVGTDFHTSTGENLTLVDGRDVIGLIAEDKNVK